MAKRVGTHEAKTRLSEYLNQVAYAGERVIVERHGKPVAALVSLADLQRLEALEQDGDDDAVKEERLRRALAEAGLVVSWPTGSPASLKDRPLIKIKGKPLSQQIIEERR